MIILNETFTNTTGTDLSSHVSDSGTGYTKHPSHTEALTIQSNRLGKDANTGTSAYFSNLILTTRDYEAEGVITDIGEVNRAFGMAVRMDTTADNMIVFRRQNITAWQLLTIIGVTVVSLETVSATFSAGAENVLRIVCKGDQYFCYINNTLTPLSPHTITNSEFSTPGRVGFRASNNHLATGYHIDRFTVNTLYGARLSNPILRPRIFAPGFAR